MNFKVGDKIKFLNETGSGEVIGIIDKNTASVLIEDGFEVPVLLKDLVLATGSYHGEESTPSVQYSKPEEAEATKAFDIESHEQMEDEEIILAFVPEENSSGFESYLINSSSYYLKYVISNEKEGEQIIYHQGELEPGIKILLRNYHPGQLSDEVNFRIQVILFSGGPYRLMAPIDMLVKFQATEMYDAARRVTNDYFHEKAILFKLYDWNAPKDVKMEIDPEELKKAMFTKGDVKPAKSKKEKVDIHRGPGEIDLHIENLVDDHSNMDNAQIIDIQLSRFRTSLETAMLHQGKRIVFIHGVGNGKLKFELRKILDTEYKKVRYQDASFKEYGYGATMVLL
jgi:hypothetical protein